jgi:protein arginine N-methyltransferase 5
VPNMAQRLIVGVERPFIRDLKEEINEKSNLGADYYVAPLFHPRFRRDSSGVSAGRLGACTRSDRELESREWVTNIVGKISDWIDLDSFDADVRQSALAVLQQEASWAGHLSLQAILLPTPRIDSANYARAVMQVFTGYQQFYVQIPMVAAVSMGNHYKHQQQDGHEYCKDGWLVWDGLRQHFGDFNRHFVALELSAACEEIPNDSVGEAWVRRWCAEPVKLILLPTSLFVANHAGYPVLSKRLQSILAILLPHCNQVVLTGASQREGGSYEHYAQYLRHLVSLNQSQLTTAERYVQGYEDTLQAPLQPLMDNLEAQTYETFERDPMKYIKYEEAMVEAIKHLTNQRQIANGGAEEDSTLVLTVVGAGRGPLVAAALSASATTGVALRVYAVEKNANAVITLRNRVLTERWHNVTVIATDMRDWRPAELCDIMVSELLGSFGDNELSPECLDGAQKCLKPAGVSIPQSYTSFLAPIATSKLWTMAKGFNSSNSTITDGLNTAYVVKFRSAFQFAQAQPLFTFAHPNWAAEEGGKIDNTR